MDEPTIPQSAAFHIQLPSFEGPLDLLLHLIKKHELNILDLPIAFVTERYLDYLQMMQELDLDVASEYLLMAATLAHIKSKMLLPQTPSAEAFEEQEEAYQEDPRAELIRRLLEYQKYKAAADELGARPVAGRDVFPRGLRAPEAQGPAPLASIDMYKLLDAFGSILKRVKGRVALEVTAERITIHERMTELSEFLRGRRSCTFEELFEGARTRYEVVVTFLALLEMTKLRITRIYQADPRSALHVQYALLDADPAAADGSEGADAADEAQTLERARDEASSPLQDDELLAREAALLDDSYDGDADSDALEGERELDELLARGAAGEAFADADDPDADGFEGAEPVARDPEPQYEPDSAEPSALAASALEGDACLPLSAASDQAHGDSIDAPSAARDPACSAAPQTVDDAHELASSEPVPSADDAQAGQPEVAPPDEESNS